MARMMTLPKIGVNLEEITITRWLVKIGDHVNGGDPIFEAETDKANQEFFAAESGILAAQLAREGDRVLVGADIAVFVDEGEEYDLQDFVPGTGAAEVAPEEFSAKESKDIWGFLDSMPGGEPPLESSPGDEGPPVEFFDREGPAVQAISEEGQTWRVSVVEGPVGQITDMSDDPAGQETDGAGPAWGDVGAECTAEQAGDETEPAACEAEAPQEQIAGEAEAMQEQITGEAGSVWRAAVAEGLEGQMAELVGAPGGQEAGEAEALQEQITGEAGSVWRAAVEEGLEGAEAPVGQIAGEAGSVWKAAVEEGLEGAEAPVEQITGEDGPVWRAAVEEGLEGAEAPVEQITGEAGPAWMAAVAEGLEGQMAELTDAPGGQDAYDEETPAELAADEEAPAEDEDDPATGLEDESAPAMEAAEKAPGSRVRISPLARGLARSLGINPGQIPPKAPGKRITAASVRDYAEKTGIGAHPALNCPEAEAMEFEAFEDEPEYNATGMAGERAQLSGVRKTIAARLSQSASEKPTAALTVTADATALLSLRESYKQNGIALSVDAVLVRTAVAALKQHPALNDAFVEEELVMNESINIGVATDTPAGLVVPIVKDADKKPLIQIGAELDALSRRAASGEAAPDDIRGGTFTITNLGMFGVEEFIPIINPPECAILAAGAIIPQYCPDDEGAPALKQCMKLTLVFDHRIVDGAPAARFLSDFKTFLECPELML